MRDELVTAVEARINRFMHNRDSAAVLSHEAVGDAAALLSAAQPDDLVALLALGLFYLCRYEALGPDKGRRELAAALQFFAPVYRQMPDYVPESVREYFDEEGAEARDWLEVLGAQAEMLLDSAVENRDLMALTTGIDLLQRVLGGLPNDDPRRPAILYNIAASLQFRYQFSNERDDLDQAIQASEAAADATPPSDPRHPRSLSNLGDVLEARYLRLGDLLALNRAIEVYDQLVTDALPDDPERPRYLARLGVMLSRRFEHTGAIRDLNKAIEVNEAAIAVTPHDSASRAGLLNNLGISLRRRYERFGTKEDLDRTIETAEAAVAATPLDSNDRAGHLSNLGISLRKRYERFGEKADLDKAIETAKAAVACAPPGHPDRATYLSSLGLSLQVRYIRTGELDDLNRAIEVDQAAVDATPPGHPTQALYLGNLAVARQTRFERLGNLDDLDGAIEAAERAVSGIPVGHSTYAGYLANLGAFLIGRYVRLGGLADIDRAIAVIRAAVSATPADHPDRGMYLSSLGAALLKRFEHIGALTDLEEAIEVMDGAVSATPADHPNRALYLTNLGTVLVRRFERSDAASDLDRAVEVAEAGLAATAPDSPYRAACLSNLGILRMARYERSGLMNDLEHAVEASQAATAFSPPDDPDRAMYLTNLGSALLRRFGYTARAADQQEAINVFREAVAVQTAPTYVRAQAAQRWGQAAADGEDWPAAAEGFAAAVRLLARVAPRSLARSDQEHWLGAFTGIGAQAAACCLRAGHVDQAVELWEQGRGVLLSQTLDTRTDLTALTEQHAPLAARFCQLRDELDAYTAVGDPAISVTARAGSPVSLRSDPALAPDQQIDRRRHLADEFDQLVAEIRSRPGFSRFLLPPPIEDLLDAASNGPVVLLNVTTIRSDALILAAGGVRVVPLPTLTPQVVQDQVVAFFVALAAAQDSGTSSNQQDRAEVDLHRILGWLWDTIAAPVLQELGITGPPDDGGLGICPRLWWVPSGLLAFLPLHAAGYHATRSDPAPATVLDWVASSYTPTIRALTYARRHNPDRAVGAAPQPNGLLVVTMPHTPAAPDLPGTLEEATLLRELFPDQVLLLHGQVTAGEAARLGLPVGPADANALHEQVGAALRGCRWAHFACHAASEMTNPSASHILLADHQVRPLTVLDLTQLRLDNADLAFLSACDTARTGARLADEAIQLASAMQLAGFRHVIATLWPIGDRQAVRIASDVYKALLEENHDVQATSHALHRAIRRRRNLDPHRPTTWAAHIHNGA